jgi:hypothetical protein
MARALSPSERRALAPLVEWFDSPAVVAGFEWWERQPARRRERYADRTPESLAPLAFKELGVGQPRARAREHRPAARRRASSSSRSSSQDPGDDDPAPDDDGDLALFRHPRFGLVNRLLAAFLDRQEVVE